MGGAGPVLDAAKDLNPIEKFSNAADSAESAVKSGAEKVGDFVSEGVEKVKGVLNPTADAQYAATAQKRADVSAAQQLIATTEASTPQEKQAALGRYGLDAGKYAQLKMNVGWPLNKEDTDALEAQRQQVEGKAPEVENPTVDPTFMLAGGLQAGAAGGVEAGVKTAAESALFQEIQAAASKFTGLATNNPYIKAIGGIALPIALSVLSRRALQGAPAPGTVLAEGEEGTATINPPPAGAPERPTGLSSVLTPEGTGGAAAAAGAAPRPVTPETVEGPAAASAAAKSVTPKPLYEMTPDELDAELERAKAASKSDAEEVFGSAEKAQQYERAYRRSQSSNPETSDAGQAEVDELTKNLTKEQENKLYGIGDETVRDPDEVKEYSRALGAISGSTPAELGDSLKYALTKLSSAPTDPAEMNSTQQMAFAQLQHGLRLATEQGFDTTEVSQAAIKSAAARFSDPEDAAFMLERYMKPAQAAIEGATAEGATEGATATQGQPPSAGEPAPAPDVHSDAAALQNATANPMTREEMQGIEIEGEEGHQLPKTPLSYSDLVRAQTYTGQVADNVVAAQKAFLNSGSDTDQAALDTAKEELESIRPQMKAIWHQAGLTLQKVGSTDPSSAQIRAVFQAMEENADAPTRMAMALSNLPSVAERNKLIEDAASMSGNGWTAKGALYKLYVNSILSLNSAGKKAVSDAANIIFQIPARGLAEMGSRAWEFGTGAESGTVGVSPGETMAMVRGMLGNFSDALKIGLDSARQGKPMFEGDVGFFDNPANEIEPSIMGGSGFENSWWGRGIDYYGHLISVPGRAIIGVDQFSKSMQFNMELYALANRQAQIEAAGEGINGAELSARVAELSQGYIEKTPGWMSDSAMQTAKINTFQQDLQGSLAKADALRQSSYFTRTLMPFFKTPVNITLQGIRQSPLAPASGVFRSTIAGGGPEAAIAASKAALGSAVIAYFTHHVLQGNITGSIPNNLKGTLRGDWLADHDAYSIRSGPEGDNRWTSYEGLEPISWLLGMAADMAPAWSYLNDGEASHAVGVFSRAAVNELGRQPMWGALHQLVNALDDIERGKTTSLGQVGTRMAAGLIPSVAANLAGGIDPIRRQTQDMVSEMRNRIPYLKEGGLPTLDSFGRPVVVPPGFMWNEFPAYVSTKMKQADPVVNEIVRLNGAVGFEPPQIPKALGGPSDSGNLDAPESQVYGASLTPAERNRWLEARNDPMPKQVPKLYDFVKQRMKSPDYEGASDAEKANELHQIFTGYQKMGEGKMLDPATPEGAALRGRVMAAYVGKAQARRPPSTASIAAP